MSKTEKILVSYTDGTTVVYDLADLDTVLASPRVECWDFAR